LDGAIRSRRDGVDRALLDGGARAAREQLESTGAPAGASLNATGALEEAAYHEPGTGQYHPAAMNAAAVDEVHRDGGACADDASRTISRKLMRCDRRNEAINPETPRLTVARHHAGPAPHRSDKLRWAAKPCVHRCANL